MPELSGGLLRGHETVPEHSGKPSRRCLELPHPFGELPLHKGEQDSTCRYLSPPFEGGDALRAEGVKQGDA